MKVSGNGPGESGIALGRDVIPGVLQLRDSTPYGLSVAPTLPDAAAQGLRGLSSPDEWLAWLRDGSLPGKVAETITPHAGDDHRDVG